jgi:AraC-like DNA-binding protein
MRRRQVKVRRPARRRPRSPTPDADLSPATVAGRHKISESYIRELFEGEGISFSEFVLGRGLVRAHRMLTDQRGAEHSIASIAFEAGFGDLSYFNRTFRRLYGTTPSEVRSATDHQDI